MGPLFFIGLSLVFLVVQKLYSKWFRNPGQLPFPPGPKASFTGNVLPSAKSWLAYTEWGKQYGPYSFIPDALCSNALPGDLIHVRVFGQHTVIVNSLKVANDLFEKRSHVYSDRPSVPMIDM